MITSEYIKCMYVPYFTQYYKLHEGKCYGGISFYDKIQYSAGLEKYLNSTLPVGQVTPKFCLPGALPRLPKFSNSLIIHKPKNGSQQACFNVINPS